MTTLRVARRGPTLRWTLIMTCLLAAAALASLASSSGPLSTSDALILGAVEGVTEFLPVSSTGHLLVAGRLLGVADGDTPVGTYAISIQIGAIVAVVTMYRERLRQIAAGLVRRDPIGRRMLTNLAVAFAPSALVGLALGDAIRARIFHPWPIIAAWFVGGAFLLWWVPRPGIRAVDGLPTRCAAMIGGAQVIALWPGVSRSLVTIAAGVLVGLTLEGAAEFSFLLGLLTLSAASCVELWSNGQTLIAEYGWVNPLLGAATATITAMLTVRWLIGYLRSHSLRVFGWYRVAAAATTVGLIAIGAM